MPSLGRHDVGTLPQRGRYSMRGGSRASSHAAAVRRTQSMTDGGASQHSGLSSQYHRSNVSQTAGSIGAY